MHVAVACQVVWLAWLLKDLAGEEVGPPILKVDNKSAILLSKSLVHFIRGCVEKKVVVECTSTAQQLADILTKPLGIIRFQELRSRIGIDKIK